MADGGCGFTISADHSDDYADVEADDILNTSIPKVGTMRQQLHSYSSCRGAKDGVDRLNIYFILVSAEHWRCREVDLTHSFHNPRAFHMVIRFR